MYGHSLNFKKNRKFTEKNVIEIYLLYAHLHIVSQIPKKFQIGPCSGFRGVVHTNGPLLNSIYGQISKFKRTQNLKINNWIGISWKFLSAVKGKLRLPKKKTKNGLTDCIMTAWRTGQNTIPLATDCVGYNDLCKIYWYLLLEEVKIYKRNGSNGFAVNCPKLCYSRIT